MTTSMDRDEPLASLLRRSPSSGPPLRVGLVIGSTGLTRVQAAIVEDLLAAEFVTLAIVVVVAGPVPSRKAAASLAWRAYRRFDERRVRIPDDPLAPASIPPRLGDAETVHVGSGSVDAVLDRLRAARLDVLVDLCPDRGADRLRAAATHGLWRLRYGDPTRYRGDPPCAWETIERDPVSTAALTCLVDASSPGLILATASFATDTGSVARNRVQPMFSSSHLVIQKLRELQAFGWDYVARHAVPEPTASRPIGGVPGNLRVLRWLVPQIARKLITRIARRVRPRDDIEYWQIATRSRRNRLDAGLDHLEMAGFRWVDAPPGHLYADPFIAERAGRAWLFFEDYPLAERRAVIACAELAPDGTLGPPERVLESRGHMSFPQVFFDGDEAYMIPETSAEGVVRLYRATEFPRGWTVHAELFPAPGLDTVGFEHDGRWWFFTTLREPRGQGYLLLLFHAERLAGPWVPHPLNPISTDVRDARGAGAVIRIGDRLIRPSQDCSRAYGYAFGLHEVVRLTTTEYEERRLVRVGPEWSPGLVGTHTYNRSESLEAVDGKVLRPRREVM